MKAFVRFTGLLILAGILYLLIEPIRLWPQLFQDVFGAYLLEWEQDSGVPPPIFAWLMAVTLFVVLLWGSSNRTIRRRK